MPAMSDRERDEVQARLAVVRARYPDRLDAAALAEIEQALTALVAAAQALRAVRLDNADEPHPPFVPFRSEP
jgi:hypothetical protein